jgi:hypothetical protein
MASNSYSSMLSLLQMWLKNQEAEKKRQHDLEMQRQKQQQEQHGGQQQQQNPMDMYNKYTQITDMLAASPAYEAPAMGSTPAATSAFGGAGELGGTAGLGAEAGSGAGAGAGTGAGAGGMATAAAPYAALAAALGAFKLNDDWMSKGSGKTFGGEMQDAWSESFGNKGWWGMLKKLF